MDFLTKEEAQNKIEKITTDNKTDEFIVVLLGKYTKGIYLQYDMTEVKNIFSNENMCDPKNIDEFNDFLSKFIQKSLKEDKTLLLIFAGHGSNSKDNYKLMFDEYDTQFNIETKKITEAIKDLRNDYPKFKCVGLIQACYSNFFDISCFDASITLGSGTSRWDLLVKALLDSIKKKEFKLSDIYKNLSIHLSIASTFIGIGEENDADFKNIEINGDYTFIQHKLGLE